MPLFPGYIESEHAAKMLGISKSRLYDYIREKRFPARRVGRSYIMRVEDIERFQANPSGRTRKKPPSWRAYKSGGQVLTTEIQVQVRTGQQKRLVAKLQAIQATDQHTFPGTIARYVVQGDTQLSNVHILLIWKTTEMPDEAQRQKHLAAFQVELADVLDWQTAQSQTNQTIIYT